MERMMDDVPARRFTSKQMILNEKGPFSREGLEKVLFGINPGDSTRVRVMVLRFDNAATASCIPNSGSSRGRYAVTVFCGPAYLDSLVSCPAHSIYLSLPSSATVSSA